MFILLKLLSRICYFKVGKISERQTVIFIIIRGSNCKNEFHYSFWEFPTKLFWLNLITNTCRRHSRLSL